jgi:beta-N-acetylhexosaminidase
VALSDQVVRDAHAVFLPAIDEESIPSHIRAHLARGGTSVLISESRKEYVDREMGAERHAVETGEWFQGLTATIRSLAGGKALVAVDQELGGIQRLHGLVTPMPSAVNAGVASDREIEMAASGLGSECLALGVNVVLSPIVDVVSGANPWLDRRTISSDAATVGRVASAFVRGLQVSGAVAATAKHFPGHPHIPLDPAVHDQATVDANRAGIEPTLEAFRAVSAAGVRVVMTGPALVPAIDADRAASRSATTVDLLRDDIGFDGVILSDDLDAPGILRGDSLGQAAIDALNAGVDWLLVAGTPQLEDLVLTVAAATGDGSLPTIRLRDAACAVRELTNDIG